MIALSGGIAGLQLFTLECKQKNSHKYNSHPCFDNLQHYNNYTMHQSARQHVAKVCH